MGANLFFFDGSDSRRFYQSLIGNLQKSGKWQMLSIEMILLSNVRGERESVRKAIEIEDC